MEETADLEKSSPVGEQRKSAFTLPGGLQVKSQRFTPGSPYLPETVVVGRGIYLVGYSEKLNRIVPSS
ncbi:MAG: hypothetical protein IPH82_17270 [Chloroflexi bacterium]|nr:hypothetical protein [Chloroflexota bacterium]